MTEIFTTVQLSNISPNIDNSLTLIQQLLLLLAIAQGNKTQQALAKILEYDPGYLNRLINGKMDLRLSSVDWIAKKLSKKVVLKFED